jgi:NitT/TauT family transport system substrate-binding protein
MFTRVRRVSCCALAVAAAALLASSCSGSSSSNGSSGALSITVGALPVVDDVGAYIAADEGIFKQFGLNVTIKPVLSSTVAIPDMKKGTIDIVGGGNYVSFIKLSASDPANPPFKILAEAATCSSGSFNILALPSSGIQTPADLENKTINLNNNIQTLMINSVLAADDVKANRVKYVVIPFPQMGAALAAHKVDAISVVEPFLTTAEENDGAQTIVNQCDGPDSSLPLSGYLSTAAWAQQNPVAAQRFQEAMAQAQEVADTDRAVVESTLLKYVKGLTKIQASTITLEQFPTSLDAKQLNRVSDLMQEAGLITNTVQASSLIG